MVITDEQIEALETEAGQAGDLEQVAICRRALDGDDDARRICADVVTADCGCGNDGNHCGCAGKSYCDCDPDSCPCGECEC